MNLTGAAKLGEFREHQPQGLPHSHVGVLVDPVAPGLQVACRNAEKKRAAPRFLFQRLLRALAEQRQLQFAHRSLHAEQQPIIGMPRIVDSVFVDDNRSYQSTEFDQRMPVTAVPCSSSSDPMRPVDTIRALPRIRSPWFANSPD